jgi:hypothetical protein
MFTDLLQEQDAPGQRGRQRQRQRCDKQQDHVSLHVPRFSSRFGPLPVHLPRTDEDDQSGEIENAEDDG